MTRGNHNRLLPGLILLATVLIYVNGLGNPFVIDDRAIVLKNFQSSESWTLPAVFQRGLFPTDPEESAYFRPLTLLTFAFNYSWARENPLGYRVVNLAIHLLVIVLTTFFLSRFTGRWVALFSTLLFALHPVHVQSVTYISSRSDPLYTALALLCLLSWVKGNESEGMKKLLCRSIALGAFFFGLLAKETMIVVFPLLVLTGFYWGPAGPWKDKIRSDLPWLGGFVVLFGMYLLLRLGLGYPLLMEGEAEMSLLLRVPTAFKIFGLYLGLVFYPAHLFLFRTMEVPQSFLEWQVVFGAILSIGMLTLGWQLRQAYRDISFGIFWYLLTLLPVLNLTVLNAPMMEHWLYLPLIGLTLAVVAAVKTLADRVGELRGAAFGLLLLALILSARTITRNAEWSDLVRLFSRNVAVHPKHSTAWLWLADALKERGKQNEAIRAYQAVLALKNTNLTALVGLADALSAAGRDDEADEILLRAVSVRPHDAWLLYALGAHRLKLGKNQDAVERLKESTRIDPSLGAYHLLGSAYLRLGQNEKAEQTFQAAVLVRPGQSKLHAGIHLDMGKLYLSQGKLKEAIEEWQLALRFDPKNEEALSLLAKHQQ
jgi:tetratricopeptide (TPR) repeat protein